MSFSSPAGRGARRALAATLALTSLALAACGDSGTEFSDPDEFVEAADAICTEAAQDVVAAFNVTLPTATIDLGVPYFEAVAEITADELAALEELEPPSGTPGNFASYLAQRRDIESVLGTAADALASEQQGTFDAAVANIEVITADANAIGEEIGFAACANVLDDENAAAVADVIEQTATSDDSEAVCRDLATESFQDQFGGLDACIRNQGAAARAGSVEINDLSGVNGARARALATLKGKSFGSGRDFRIDLAFEDGGWRVQVVQPLR